MYWRDWTLLGCACLCCSSRRNPHHMVSLSSWIKNTACLIHLVWLTHYLSLQHLSRLCFCGAEAVRVKLHFLTNFTPPPPPTPPLPEFLVTGASCCCCWFGISSWQNLREFYVNGKFIVKVDISPLMTVNAELLWEVTFCVHLWEHLDIEHL